MPPFGKLAKLVCFHVKLKWARLGIVTVVVNITRNVSPELPFHQDTKLFGQIAQTSHWSIENWFENDKLNLYAAVAHTGYEEVQAKL